MSMPVQPTAQSLPSGTGNDVKDILASAGQLTAGMEEVGKHNVESQKRKELLEAQKLMQQQYLAALPANQAIPIGGGASATQAVMPRSASMPTSDNPAQQAKDAVANLWNEGQQLIANTAQSATQFVTGAPAQAVTIPANAVAMNSGTPAMPPSFNFSPADLKGGSRVGGVTFIDPLGGKGTLTSPFGMRNHPVHGGQKMHKGQDLAAAQGTPILSVAEGTVTVNASDPSGYGNWIEIKHKNGKSTRYGHMKDKSPLAVGAEVKQGQVIGAVGSTGSSTGPHLHFEVRDTQGQAEDPIAYLPGDKDPSKAPSPSAKAPVAKAPKGSNPSLKT